MTQAAVQSSAGTSSSRHRPRRLSRFSPSGSATSSRRSTTCSAAPIAETVFEPRVGGHIYDRATDGTVCRWARVLVYDPPRRVVFSWDIGPTWQLETDPEKASEVEVRFIEEAPTAPASSSSTGTSTATVQVGSRRRRRRPRPGLAAVPRPVRGSVRRRGASEFRGSRPVPLCEPRVGRNRSATGSLYREPGGNPFRVAVLEACRPIAAAAQRPHGVVGVHAVRAAAVGDDVAVLGHLPQPTGRARRPAATPRRRCARPGTPPPAGRPAPRRLRRAAAGPAGHGSRRPGVDRSPR